MHRTVCIAVSIMMAAATAATAADRSAPPTKHEEIQKQTGIMAPTDLKALKEQKDSGVPAVQDKAGAVTPSSLKENRNLPAVQDKAGAISPSSLKENRNLPAVQDKAGAVTPSSLK